METNGAAMNETADDIQQLAHDTSGLISFPPEARDQKEVTPPSSRLDPGGDPNRTLDAAPAQRPRTRRPHPAWLQQGITGSKVSAALFDGSSTNPKDHLIELEDDSMETEPDVRVYFHLIGLYVQGDPFEKPPQGIEERREWDAGLVRKGREYLKAARARGHGYYVDIQHLTGLDLAVKAPLGSKFYRMPAVAIVEDFLTQKLQSMPSEGGFYDDNCCRGHPDPYIDENILTNVRIPLWWAECLLDGVLPGTRGFDTPIVLSYSNAHPIMELCQGMEQDFTRIRHIVLDHTVHEDNQWYDATLCAMVLRRDWPEPDYA